MKALKKRSVLLLVIAMTFALAACEAGASSDSALGSAAADAEPAATVNNTDNDLQTVTPGKLTIATGEPAWEPWVLNDDPASGEGFEAAVAYAVAEKLGFSKENVIWVRTTFAEAIRPGAKNFDFNLQQYSITDERRQTVDFSSPYYKEPRVIITNKDNKFAAAATVTAFKDALFGVASGDIALQITEDLINPKQKVVVYNDLVAVINAINSGRIDAVVAGVAEADYIVSSGQIEDGVIVGKLPGSEDMASNLGLLLEKDSPLTAAVSSAVDELIADGTIDGFIEKYLSQYNVPELTQE
jgi:polar amino acid transport system substrate-binding protein